MKAPKIIALSFDDGPSDDTPGILDTLERYGAAATFFVLGSHIEGREDLLLRMRAVGCEIGNHTYGHPRLTTLSPAGVAGELNAATEAIRAATGQTPTLMRPPYGEWGADLPEISLRHCLLPVLWTLSTHDYDGKTADAIERAVLESVRPGDIVLLHDGSPDGHSRAATAEAVARLVPELQAHGYRFATVSEVLRQHRRTRRYVVPGEPGCGRPTATSRLRRFMRVRR